MSKCDCYQIGGSWIAEDPDCPEHGSEAQQRRERFEQVERELAAAKVENERLTATIAAKDEEIKRLNAWLDYTRRALTGEEE